MIRLIQKPPFYPIDATIYHRNNCMIALTSILNTCRQMIEGFTQSITNSL
jgi:hypothetical protein